MESLEYKIRKDILYKLQIYKETNNLEALKINYPLFFQSKIKDVRHSFPYAIEHRLIRNKNDFYTTFLARRNLIEDISYIKKFNEMLYKYQLENYMKEDLISIYIEAIKNQSLNSFFLADICRIINEISNKENNLSKEKVLKIYNSLINSCKNNKDINLFEKI